MIVTDIRGQQMHAEEIGAGTNSLVFDASALPAGIYIMRFISDGMNINRKIILR